MTKNYVNTKEMVQDWNEFILDESLRKLDTDIDGLESRVIEYYSDFSDINKKDTLMEIVRVFRDIVESIEIFKTLYRKDYTNDGLY